MTREMPDNVRAADAHAVVYGCDNELSDAPGGRVCRPPRSRLTLAPG